jgi:hypothetical protein
MRIEGKKLDKLKEVYAAESRSKSVRDFKANIWEDITVKIRYFKGGGHKVKRDDFLKWIKVLLDLDRLSKMIPTSHSTLILDNQFKGHIYIKGLLLEGEPVPLFKFSYNFWEGEANRDRQRLSIPREEAKSLARIWGEAV